MVLDSLERSRVNIKDLSLPEPGRLTLPLLFVPKTDISDRDWNALTYGLNFRVERSWKKSLQHYFYLRSIDPERYSKFAIGEEQWKWTKEVVEESRAEEIITNFALATVFFPQKRDELNLNSLTEKLMTAYLSDLREDHKWEDFHQNVFYHSIIFPNSVPNLGLDEESWKGIQDCYKKYLGQVRSIPHRVNNAVDMLALMKINYPSRFNEVKLKPEILRKTRELFENYHRQGRWYKFVRSAFDLAILGAKEIKFTDQGMEVIGQSKLQTLSSENTPDLPQRRKF